MMQPNVRDTNCKYGIAVLTKTLTPTAEAFVPVAKMPVKVGYFSTVAKYKLIIQFIKVLKGIEQELVSDFLYL